MRLSLTFTVVAWLILLLVLPGTLVRGATLGTPVHLDVGDRPTDSFRSLGDLGFLVSDHMLWVTDGTQTGTRALLPEGVAVGDNFMRSSGMDLLFLEVFNGAAVELWRTDGTPEDTLLIENDPATDFRAMWLYGIEEIDKWYWPREEPWISDGTRPGTRLLRDLYPGGDFNPGRPAPHDGFLYFAGSPDPLDGFSGLDLAVTDGTTEGTRLVDLDLGPSAQVAVVLNLIDTVVLFVAEPIDGEAAYRYSVWKTDGTRPGTELLLDLGRIEGWSYPAKVASTFTEMYGPSPAHFAVISLLPEWDPDCVDTFPCIVQSDLVVTDGTPEGTQVIRQSTQRFPGSTLMYGTDSRFYFIEVTPEGTVRFWSSDGTPGGTRDSTDFCGPECEFGGIIGLVGDRAIVTASDPAHGLEAWVTDGTAAGSELLADLCPGPCDTIPGFPAVFKDELLFFQASGLDPLEGYFAWSPGGLPLGTPAGFEGLVPPSSRRWVFSEHFLFFNAGGPGGGQLLASPVLPWESWSSSPSVAGFRFQVRITSPSGGRIEGRLETDCISETACFSGAVPGRSEVFVRVVGPKPNGFLWPTLAKFTTSRVEVWIEQEETGEVRVYDLRGARPGFDELPGLFDRDGFRPPASPPLERPLSTSTSSLKRLVAGLSARSGDWFVSPLFPDFDFRVELTSPSGQPLPVQVDPECIDETICLSGAIPGRSEVFLRIVGPKPNGYLWPTLVKFTTSVVDIWIRQRSTGEEQHYRLRGAAPGFDDLTGRFDRTGFFP